MKLPLSLCLALAASANSVASETVRDKAVLFGAVADENCDATTFGEESAAATVWAAKFAVNTVIGFASSFLDKATEATTVTRSANAPGYFYRWSGLKKRWLPAGGCVRFWYAQQQANPVGVKAAADYGASPQGVELAWETLTTRWAELAFSEQPYLYGEVRLSISDFDNTVVLQPVVLFARRPPEAQGFGRKTTRLAVALDLRGLSSSSVVATHTFELPDVSDGAVLVRGRGATKGLSSAWSTLPPPPSQAAKPEETKAGAFNALVTFTSTSDGTLIGKTISSAWNTHKEELVEALTPTSKAQKSAIQQQAVVDAFDAVSEVLSAQEKLDAAEAAQKPKLALEVQKAQYLADHKLQAAGLPARYGVSGP